MSALGAGDLNSQSRMDTEISNRLKEMNRLKAEIANIKAVMDGLGQAGGLNLPLGTRTATWDATDWANLASAIADANTALQGWPTTFASRVWGPVGE